MRKRNEKTAVLEADATEEVSPPTLAFFESSILLRMSFAWDSRAAKLEAFRGSEDSFNFFAFFFPPSLTFGVLGAFGVFGGFRVLWALVDLELFCRAFA